MFEQQFLKTIGGFNNRDFGGDVFSYSPSEDSIADILGVGYFDEAWQQLNSGDTIIVNRSEGGLSVLWVEESIRQGVKVEVELTGTPISTSISAPGAIPITANVVDIETAGVNDAFSLAAGTEGQLIKLIHRVAGGDALITVTNPLGFATINLVALGDAATLQYLSGTWVILSTTGGTIVA